MQVITLADSVAQVEEPVGGDPRRGVEGHLASAVDDAPALQVCASVVLRTAVAALQSKLAVVEFLKRFGGLLARGFVCRILKSSFAGSLVCCQVLPILGVAINPLAEVAERQTR